MDEDSEIEATKKIPENNQFEEHIVPNYSMTGIIKDQDHVTSTENIDKNLGNIY